MICFVNDEITCIMSHSFCEIASFPSLSVEGSSYVLSKSSSIVIRRVNEDGVCETRSPVPLGGWLLKLWKYKTVL